MSRSGYSDDNDDGTAGLYRGAVQSATNGKRGQKLMRDLLAALDAMPEKRLIANDFQSEGNYCSLGALGAARGVDLSDLDPEDDYYTAPVLGKRFDMAECLAREIMYENDERGRWNGKESPEARWQRMRGWVAGQIKATQS